MLYAVSAPEILKEGVPLIGRHQMLSDTRFVFEFVVEFVEHARRFAAGISLGEVQTIRPKPVFQLSEQRSRISEISAPARRHEIGDHQTIDRVWRIGAGEIMNDDATARVRKLIPNGAAFAKRSIHRQFALRAFIAANELEDAMLAGILASHKRRPG